MKTQTCHPCTLEGNWPRPPHKLTKELEPASSVPAEQQCWMVQMMGGQGVQGEGD
jgi:hypothetical protein